MTLVLISPRSVDAQQNPDIGEGYPVVPGIGGSVVETTPLDTIGAGSPLPSVISAVSRHIIASSAGTPVASSVAVEVNGRGRRHPELIARERIPVGQLVDAYEEFYPSDEFLPILASTNRRSVLRPPFGAHVRTQSAPAGLPGSRSATVSYRFAIDSSVQSIAGWYAREYGFEFNVVHMPYGEGSSGGIVTLARGVRRFDNCVVSIMIWNPTAQRRKRGATTYSHTTSIEVQERLFRPRTDLVVEGPDAVVEFTWKVPYRNLIAQASRRYQIDPYLLAALIQQESNFNANVLSVDSAMGLTQMIPTTAAMLGVADPNNPAQAVDGGARYLKMQLRRFKGDPELALAAYNAGPGNVMKFGGIPPFQETREYVRRIMDRYRERAGGSFARKAKVVRSSTRG